MMVQCSMKYTDIENEYTDTLISMILYIRNEELYG